MNLIDTKNNIIRWVSTCETRDHFHGIEMAVTNCLLTKKKNCHVEDVEEAEHEVNCAVIARIKEIGLKPVEDEVVSAVDMDSSFEESYGAMLNNVNSQKL